MNILVTGAAGFIGFSLINELVKNKNLNILGIDNLDKYYSVKLKNKRIKILKKNKNFVFKKIDIKKDELLYKLLVNNASLHPPKS